MSSPTLSNISQNDIKILEKQQLLAQLKEAVRLCQAERTAQKKRREVEEKTREKAERQRVVEEEEKKKRMLEYL